jgi:hypothetical protein
MNRLLRLAGLTLAFALSTVALPSRAAAVPFCYCEVYCSSGFEIMVQAQSRYQCGQFFQETCGGSGTWVCQYE